MLLPPVYPPFLERKLKLLPHRICLHLHQKVMPEESIGSPGILLYVPLYVPIKQITPIISESTSLPIKKPLKQQSVGKKGQPGLHIPFRIKLSEHQSVPSKKGHKRDIMGPLHRMSAFQQPVSVPGRYGKLVGSIRFLQGK